MADNLEWADTWNGNLQFDLSFPENAALNCTGDQFFDFGLWDTEDSNTPSSFHQDNAYNLLWCIPATTSSSHIEHPWISLENDGLQCTPVLDVLIDNPAEPASAATDLDQSTGGESAADNGLARSSQAIPVKRSFETMMTTFPSTGSTTTQKRRRYDTPRRQKVALMRKVKPCSRCRSRKIAVGLQKDRMGEIMILIHIQCKFPGPCDSCRRTAGSISLARYICIRQSLLDLRFAVSGMLALNNVLFRYLTRADILAQSVTEEFLEKELGSYEGPKKQIACKIYWDHKAPQGYSLLLTVQNYSARNCNAQRLVSRQVFDCGVLGVFYDTWESKRYAISPDKLPTVQNLVDWVQVDHSVSDSVIEQRLMVSLTELIEQYCAYESRLPMVRKLFSLGKRNLIAFRSNNWKVRLQF
jgi:hypothetical protein